VRRYTNEDELDKRRRTHDYNIEIIIKYTCLAAFIALIVFLLLIFIDRCITDPKFQDQVLGVIQQNLSGIIFTGLSILGISRFIKR